MNDGTPLNPAPDPAAEHGQAAGGASCRVRRSYGPTYAGAFAQEGDGEEPGPRTGAHGTGSDQQPAPAPVPFPHRTPRRRARNPTKRTHKLTTRLSGAEKTEITTAARKKAVTTAHFLATAALAAARDPAPRDAEERLNAAIDELAALRAQLARVGNNINQIARIHNSGGHVQPSHLGHALTALIRVLARIDDAAQALVRTCTR